MLIVAFSWDTLLGKRDTGFMTLPTENFSPLGMSFFMNKCSLFIHFHKKIKIAQVRQYDYNDVSKQIDKLVETSYHYDDMETVRIMKQIVPEYKSKNSVYESLD